MRPLSRQALGTANVARVALLTLGRFPKALSMARSLKSAGWRVIVADPFKWHLCRVSSAAAKSVQVRVPNDDADGFIDDLLEIIKMEHVSLVVPISEESHFVASLHSKVPSSVTVLGPSEADYKALHHKLRFIERAEKLGLTVPETHMLGSVRGSSLGALRDTYVKPIAGCSGIGVRRHSTDEPPIPASGDGELIQAAIEGQLVSTLSLLHDGEICATTVYKGEVFSGSVAVCFRPAANDELIRQWIESFSTDLTYTGFIAFDFIVDQAGTPWAIECNPRLTSGIHFLDPKALGEWLKLENPGRLTDSANSACQQWAYSTLTEAYALLFKGQFNDFIKSMKLLFGAKDVVWSWKDPLPFLLMTPLSWPILWPAIRERISLGEASQRDIAPHWQHRE